MVVQDLRYALRQLRHAPGFALTVALTLALSVGVATAVFCVIDTVILRPLPYVHPERIVSIQSISRSGYTQPASWPSFRRVAWVLVAGTLAGIVLTFFARRIIGIIIYFEAQREAGSLVMIALALIFVGLVAALIPAVRAASIEPMQALRTE